jgi:hypothetical protein
MVHRWYHLLPFAELGCRVERSVRDGVVSGRYAKFNRLEGEHARFMGHAIWKYVADVYGPGVIPNILYMTRVSRNAGERLPLCAGRFVEDARTGMPGSLPEPFPGRGPHPPSGQPGASAHPHEEAAHIQPVQGKSERALPGLGEQ